MTRKERTTNCVMFRAFEQRHANGTILCETFSSHQDLHCMQRFVFFYSVLLKVFFIHFPGIESAAFMIISSFLFFKTEGADKNDFVLNTIIFNSHFLQD